MERRRSLLKIAALRSERERQVGVNIGDKQSVSLSSITAFIGAPVPIGTSDFTLEYFGNAYWATSGNSPLIFNNNSRYPYGKGSLLIYGNSKVAVQWVLFEMPSSGAPTDDSIFLSAGDRETPFHFVVTRKGTTVKAYFNGELKATKEQSAVKDLGDFRLGMSNGSNMVMSRIYNYAMDADEVKTLYNDGDPAGYIVPKSRRLQATRYIRLMAPMTTDGWSSYNAQSIPPTIVDDALAMTYPTETGQGYNNGIWRPLSVNVENECYFLLKFKAKADDDNTRITSFVGVGSGLPYYKHDVIASTSFTEYYAVFKNTRGVPMTSIGFYPIFNTSGNGKFYIKDVSVTSIGLIAEYLPQNLVGQWHEKPFDLSGRNSYTWTGDTEPIYSRSVLLGKTCKSGTTISIKGTVSDYQSGAPFIYAGRGRADIPAKDGDFTVMVTGLDAFDRVSYYGGLDGTDRRLTITIDSVELIPDVALSWLDSGKQLPLNDEYLPPLLEPIVIGDATPIHITGGNSYTWTGADDSTYGKLILISRTLNVGSRYRISITVSDYEAGSPFINISGTDSASIPGANGTYELELAYTADYPNRIILYGGKSGTDRRLTLTVNSIEPIVEHSYDLTANGTPQIIIK